MIATTITPDGGDRYQRGCVDVTKDDVNISGARRQIKKIMTRNNNSGGCMDGNTDSSMTVVGLSSLANDDSLIASTAVVTPSSHDPDNDNGYTTINDDDDYSTAHYSPLTPSCSTNRMTITNQKPYISLRQQQQPPLTLFRTPWNQKIQMTPITMALTTASSSTTTPPSFLFYHGDVTVDSICDDSNEIKHFNLSNGVELVDDCEDEANTITTSSPMTTPRTNDYDMEYNSPFKSYMTILDERLDSVTKELHRLDCRIEQCYSNDDDDDDDYNNEKAIYNDLYGNEDEMSKYYCYLVDDNVVDDRNDCHRVAIINVTNDEQHECHHGNEIMSDEDENDTENIVPNSLYNNPRSDSTGSDSKSVDGDSTCKKIIHRRHPMSDREMNIVNSCHSSSDRSHRLPLQKLSCQPHQQEHINCVIGVSPFDSCGTEVRRELWKEGAFTLCDNSNNDERPIQLFPTARSISDEIQQATKEREIVTKEREIVTKEHDQLLNLVVELQQLRREDAATNMQLQREFQLSLVEIGQLRSKLNNQETAFREDNERLSLAMEVTPTKKLTSAETLYHDTTVRLRENIKVLELRNSKLVSEVEQLTSSLNVVTEHNKVLHTRIEDDSAAYNELLQDNIVTEEKQIRLLNVVNDLTLSSNTKRLDYEKKIDSLRTLLEVEKTANTTIVKNLKRTCNDVMFQTKSLEGSLSFLLSEKIDHVNSLQKKLLLLLDSQAENESLSMQLLDLHKSEEVKGQEIKVMQQQFEIVRAQRDELFGKSAKLKKSLTRSIQLLEMSKDRESQIMSLNESIVTLQTKLSYKDTHLARMSSRLQELEQQQTDSSDRDSQDSLMEKAAHFQHLAAKLAISLLQLRIKWKQSNEYNLVAQLAAQNEKVATLERCVDGVTADRHALAITHFRLHEKVTATAAEIAAEEKAQLKSQIRSLSEKIMDQDDELQLLRAREMNQAEILVENDQLLEENSCIVRELDRKINDKKRDSRAVDCSAVDSKESSIAYYRDSLEMATPVSADVKTLLDHIHKLESQLESSVVEVDVVKETIKSHETTISDLCNRIISLKKQNASREGQLSSLLSRVDIYVSERDGLALQLDKSVMELNCVREERNELASLLKDAETSAIDEEKMCIEVKHLRVGLAKSQEELATTKRDCHVVHRQSMALKDIVGKAKILLEKSENENNRLQYELDNALLAAMKETQEDSSRTPHVAFIEQFNNIRPVAKCGNNELTMLAVRQSTDTGAIIDLDDRQQASSNNNCVNNNTEPPKVSSIFMKKGLSMFDLLKDTHKSGRKDNMKYRN